MYTEYKGYRIYTLDYNLYEVVSPSGQVIGHSDFIMGAMRIVDEEVRHE